MSTVSTLTHYMETGPREICMKVKLSALVKDDCPPLVRPGGTCPALAEPRVSVRQKLLDGTVPQRVELQEHPLRGEKKALQQLLQRDREVTRGGAFQGTFFRAVYTSISTCMTNRSEDWMICSITSVL